MPPAVSFRPVNQLLPAVQESQRLDLDVGVRPLRDHDSRLTGRRVGLDDVDAFEVAGGAVVVRPCRPFGLSHRRRPPAARARRSSTGAVTSAICWSLNASV